MSRTSPFYIDARGILWIHRKEIHVTPNEQIMLELLRDRSLVTIDQFTIALWQYDEGPQNEFEVIRTMVYKLRKKLKGTGVGIKNYWGRGYALYIDDPPDSPGCTGPIGYPM